MQRNIMLKKIHLLFALAIAIPLSFGQIFAADTVTVQTFTFDSIMTRQAKFKFPEPNEKFQRVIAKYRLKCDAKTQHDLLGCGEWDYLAYLRKLVPTGNNSFAVKEQPEREFYNINLPSGTTTVKLTDSKVFDKYRKDIVKNTANAAAPQTHAMPAGTESHGGFANHQFILLYDDLLASGLTADTKIGQITFEANIVDTVENFYVRIAQLGKASKTLNEYGYYSFDTVCFQSIVAPEDCIGGKVTLGFFKDYQWDAKGNLLVEFIGNTKANSQNIFKGSMASTNRAVTLDIPMASYAKLSGMNPRIEANPLPTISGKQHFTFEGWVKMNKGLPDGRKLIYSIGDRVNIFFSNINNDSAQITIEINDGRQSPNAAVAVDRITYSNQDKVPVGLGAVLRYDQWNHVAVVYNGETSTTFPEMIQVYVNGVAKPVFFLRWYDDEASWNVRMPRFIDDQPASFTIGRGVFAGCFDEVRVWDVSLDSVTVKSWYRKAVDNTHPKYANLINNFSFNDEYASHTIQNTGTDAVAAKAIGNVSFIAQGIAPRVSAQTNFIPNVSFISGDFTYSSHTSEIESTREQIAASIVSYDSISPRPYYPAVSQVEYKYAAYSYTYDAAGKAVDSTAVTTAAKDYETNVPTFTYETKPYPIKQIFELGRFTTPYGIGLDLGPNGFEWEYDLTDYMHELRDSVEILAHNNQELIDLKFLFIKGEPVRDVLRVVAPWGPASSNKYKDYASDAIFQDTVITLLPATKSVKAKVRISGHGAEGRSDDVPSGCCEFMFNNHYLYSREDLADPYSYVEAGKWKVEENCYDNPVYPQGGTWNVPREGWCPGGTVKDYEFDLTPYIIDGKVSVDYEIESQKLPANPNLGNGNYFINVHIVEYAKSTYDNDLEILEIINPSTADIYSRINPICNGIKVVVRNNTDDFSKPLKPFDLKLTNGENTFIQSGIISPIAHTMDTIDIMLSDPTFWVTDNHEPTIEASITTEDDNMSNNTAVTKFKLPDIYQKDNFKIRYKTNLRANTYSLKVYNFDNQLVKTLAANGNNQIYNFELNDLPNGCYRMELVDMAAYYGLTWSFYPDQGSGNISITDATGTALKTFNSDFGKSIVYPFVLDGFSSIASHDIVNSISIYPNPTADNLIITATEDFGSAVVRIYDLSGKTVFDRVMDINTSESISLDISSLTAGTYSICISIGEKSQWNKFIKR